MRWMRTQMMSAVIEDAGYRIGEFEFRSRLIIGSGKYESFEQNLACAEASGAEMVTVALRRVNFDATKGPRLLDVISPKRFTILPNTAGCYSAEDAVTTAQMGRELLETNLIKLEVIGDERTLFPDVPATLEAARILVADGFTVLPYITDDPVACQRLEAMGCPAVMPLAAPIGSGMGIRNPANLRIIMETVEVPVIVDAGVGTASDAAYAMELGATALLMNTAIAGSQGSAQDGRRNAQSRRSRARRVRSGAGCRSGSTPRLRAPSMALRISSAPRPILCAVLDGADLGPTPEHSSLCALPARVSIGSSCAIENSRATHSSRVAVALVSARTKISDQLGIGDREHLDRPRVVMNRRADIALAAGADGVHLGFDAIDAPSARQRCSAADALIGASFHSTIEVERAMTAAEGDALSYAHLAPIWDPISKAATRPALGTEALATGGRLRSSAAGPGRHRCGALGAGDPSRGGGCRGHRAAQQGRRSGDRRTSS